VGEGFESLWEGWGRPVKRLGKGRTHGQGVLRVEDPVKWWGTKETQRGKRNRGGLKNL